MTDEKRLFFAAEITAAWPLNFPPARIIDEQYRHMTLAFLGKTSVSHLLDAVKNIPQPEIEFGVGGCSRKWIFLPDEENARVIAADAEWISDGQPFLDFQAALEAWLKNLNFLHKDNRAFFPHITVGRGTFDVETWKKFPCSIPFYLSTIALQESLGYSHYKPIWRHRFTPPFEEIEHTADIAFLVRGKNFLDLYNHAFLALTFKCPPLVAFRAGHAEMASLDQVIKTLNFTLGIADQAIGVPFKAVSYHDELRPGKYLEWVMIVDI